MYKDIHDSIICHSSKCKQLCHQKMNEKKIVLWYIQTVEYYKMKTNKEQLYTTTYNYLACNMLAYLVCCFVFTLGCKLYESIGHLFCSHLSLQFLQQHLVHSSAEEAPK